MDTRASWVIVLSFVIACAPALASGEVVVSSLRVSGDSTVSGAAAALFVNPTEDGAWFEATASSAVVARTHQTFVSNAVGPRVSVYDTQGKTTETSEFGASRLASTAFPAGAAMLVRAISSDATITALAPGAISIAPVKDPRFAQNGQTTSTHGGSEELTVEAMVPGEFVNVSPETAEFEIRGDVTLLVYGAAYAIDSAGETREMSTGLVADSTTPVVETGRTESHLVTLRDAVVKVRSPTLANLMMGQAKVSFVGALEVLGESSPLDVPTLASGEPGRYAGSATLDLAPASGGLALAAPPAVASATVAPAPSGAGLVWLVGGLAVVALTVALVAGRARSARGDDLELAVLAMEERRWSDALPHLDRLAAREPQNAVVLMDRAICLEESGRLAEARAGYEQALRVEPHNAEAHYYYARVLARLRLATGALAHLSRALALDARLAELARAESAFGAFADHPQFLGIVDR